MVGYGVTIIGPEPLAASVLVNAVECRLDTKSSAQNALEANNRTIAAKIAFFIFLPFPIKRLLRFCQSLRFSPFAGAIMASGVKKFD
jgi:hypothetical protein